MIRQLRAKPKAWIEWPTVAMLAASYGVFALASAYSGPIGYWLAFPAMAVAIALHSSLQHEALHGHPTRSASINEALVFVPLGLFYPYRRFKTLHLRHHHDERLTDPYDDPESFYLAGRDYCALPAAMRVLLTINNSLAGRLVLGPALMVTAFWRQEARLIARGEGAVIDAWLRHAVGVAMLAWWLESVCGIAFWLYALVPAYAGLSLVCIRTYCEHRWAPQVEGRTIIVERARVLNWLFLNNNLHLVHHRLPTAPWYELPALFRARRAEWIAVNGGYVYRDYLAIARDWLLRPKEPVAHPALRADDAPARAFLPETTKVATIDGHAAVPASPPHE